jgi:hypothetical protein
VGRQCGQTEHRKGGRQDGNGDVLVYFHKEMIDKFAVVIESEMQDED